MQRLYLQHQHQDISTDVCNRTQAGREAEKAGRVVTGCTSPSIKVKPEVSTASASFSVSIPGMVFARSYL